MTTQKQSNLLLGIVIAAGIISISCGSISTITPTPALDANLIATYIYETSLASNLQTLAVSSPTVEFTRTSAPTSTGTPIPASSTSMNTSNVAGASCIPSNVPQTGKVVQVIDGDTIRVTLDQDGLTYSVRYIGMDTPENTSQVEYFGLEATTKNTELVGGKTVILIKDVSETDSFGRLLRYVLVDNMFVNYELVAQGYANIASYPPDIACIPTFQTAEQQASASKLGLWAAPPTIAPLPTLSGAGGNAACNCNGPDLDCADFGTHASAQACFNYCSSQGFGDIFDLDRDSDSSACETLP